MSPSFLSIDINIHTEPWQRERREERERNMRFVRPPIQSIDSMCLNFGRKSHSIKHNGFRKQ